MKRTAAAKKSRCVPCFGRPLEDIYAEGGGLPPVFWDTLRLLSLRALTMPGLFRQQPIGRSRSSSSSGSGSGSGGGDAAPLISDDSSSSIGSSDSDGSASGSRECSMLTDDADGQNSGRKVLLCKRLYDSGQDALKVLPSTTKDLHAVAGILKLWVSSLPEPVIPARLHAAAVATVTDHSSKDAQVAALHSVLRQCEHRVLQVLFPLMEFLHHYCLNQPSARRERQELARIFAPLVLRPAGRSVMAPADDGGAAVTCVEHMIREYRTLFVARKRAVVPPCLPTAKVATPPATVAPAATAASLAIAAVAAAVPATTTAAAAIAASPAGYAAPADVKMSEAAAAAANVGDAPAKVQSSRRLAPLKLSCAGADACHGVTAHSIDDLPDSPEGDLDASSDTGVGVATDSALEAAVADLLFSSTCTLFGEPAAASVAHPAADAAAPPALAPQQPRDFFTTSPESSPESSPVRRQLATAAAGSGCDAADMEADGGYKHEHGSLSPTSVPGGWAAMSDGDSSSAGSDGSGDEALAEAERTCAAASAFAAPAHASPLVFGDTPALHTAAGCAAAGFPADDEDAILQAQLSEDMDDGLNPDGGGGSTPCSGGGLLEAPSAVVSYAAQNPAGAAGGLPIGVAQVAAEKAALKRQLRQLDADFEASTGRAPGRADKEALRPLYTRYWRLKRTLAAATAAAGNAPSQPQAVAMEA